MKLKIALIFILIILITVLTFGSVVNADEYIIKPEKVNYYDSIYSATPGGGSFFDPDKTYNSFFSPYATSEVKVTSSLSCSFALYFSYDYISPSFNDKNFLILKNDLIDSIRLLHHNGSGTYSYDIKVLDKYELITGYIIVFFNITYNSNITIPSGTLGFYNVSDYDIWGPSFMISYSPLEYDYTFLSNAKVSRLWLNYINIECDYNLPIICTSNAFVLVLKSGFSTVVGGINPDSHISSKLLVNGIEFDTRETGQFLGGVYDIHFDNSLKNSNFNFKLLLNNSHSCDFNVQGPDEVMFYFDFGTLIPYSEDVGYSGGQNYGSWSSNSCDWYDIPCHLGNAIGYLVYEFPLTKPITTLFSGLVGYLDTFFDISSEFSGVEVIYGVLITMIVVGIVVALFKG